MATHREYSGFHIDTVGRVVRKTLLNECVTLPVAAAATWLSQESSAATLGKVLEFAATLGLNLTPAIVSRIARVALCLGGAGFLLSANRFLNKWSANNFTRSTPGEWSHWEREIVVVTGGSSGIGQNIVKGLLARNPRTTIVILDFAPLSWTPPAGTLGKTLHYYQADLSRPDVIRDVCARVRAEVGHPTVLINNAGLGRGYTVMEGAYADVEVTFKTNLIAPFLLCKEFLPDMVKNNHGHIVSICSMSAVVPPPEMVDYAASKAGIQSLYEGLALELKYRHDAPRVRLTNCLFNFIQTPLLTSAGQERPLQPQFFAPLLHVETVSEAIVNGLYSGYGNIIYLPGLMRYITMLVS